MDKDLKINKQKDYYICDKHGELSNHKYHKLDVHKITTIRLRNCWAENLCNQCLIDFLTKFKCKVEKRND